MNWLYVTLLLSIGSIHASDKHLSIEKTMIGSYNNVLHHIIQAHDPIQKAKKEIIKQPSVILYMCSHFGFDFLNAILAHSTADEQNAIVMKLQQVYLGSTLKNPLCFTSNQHANKSISSNMQNTLNVQQPIDTNKVQSTLRFLKAHTESVQKYYMMYHMQSYQNVIPQEWFNRVHISVKQMDDESQQELITYLSKEIPVKKEFPIKPLVHHNETSMQRKSIRKPNIQTIRTFCRLPQQHENGFFCWPLVEKNECINKKR